MDNSVIKNLDELLGPFLNGNVMKGFSSKPLTAAGENYGSLMLRVEIILQKKDSEDESTLHLVAKMSPPNEWLKLMFNVPVTFKKEIAVYKTIVPTLKAFQCENSASDIISCFPECYGARISLNPESMSVDDDAVLLLENLILSGYEVVDRMKGFDLETTKLIIKDLATFHALPIAIKLLKPDIFNSKILPHLGKLQAFDKISEETEAAMFDTIISNAKPNQDCLPLIENVESALKSNLHALKNKPPPREPFATITHNDYWVNNTMIKFANGKPVKNKMVDFQLIEYGSPGNDIVFFLFSSVQKQVLDLHYDELLKVYYDTFIATLRSLNCSTEPFTFKLFQEEIEMAAKTTQFFHVMVMLKPIFSRKGAVKELSELTEADLMTEDALADEYRQKVPEMILHFAKRKWI